jgi:hypothetical protein
VVVDFNNCRTGVYPSRFVFSGARFNNINYNSSIGTNKTANLSFNFDIDPDFGDRGIFASGNVLYGPADSPLEASNAGLTSGLLGTESSIEYELSASEAYILKY